MIWPRYYECVIGQNIAEAIYIVEFVGNILLLVQLFPIAT